jgi:hypothetical protein
MVLLPGTSGGRGHERPDASASLLFVHTGRQRGARSNRIVLFSLPPK